MASHVQARVLVIDASKTPRKALRRANELLKRTYFMVEGAVINKSPWPDYSDRHHYLKNKRRPTSEFTMTKPPGTPPVEDITKKSTIAISHEKQNSNEKS